MTGTGANWEMALSRGKVVGRTGIEPVTLGLKVPCSTN